MKKVAKFGGSSLADASKFQKVKDIVLKDRDIHYVVVSALGKRDKKDNKITDLLYLVYQHAKYHVNFSSLWEEIEKRYLSVASALNLAIDLRPEFEKLLSPLKEGKIKEEELVSRGEYLSAKLMASYLGFDFLDSKSLIRFTYEGKVDEKETEKAIEEGLKGHDYAVIPGFYGSYPNGEICLFSRGGSDVSGSYIARYGACDLYENFTDVSGFYMADPHIVENPRKIPFVSYDELRELAYGGAGVLQQDTILPLMDKNIPLLVLNTNAPEEEGTVISNEIHEHSHLITGITGKKNYLAFTFTKRRSEDTLLALRKVLDVFATYHVPVEHLPTSIDSFSVVVEKNKIEERFYDVIADLKKIEEIEKIEEEDDLALLAVVGSNMVKKPGTSGRILSIFGQEHINIKLIDQGVKELNIIIGVSNEDFERSLKSLYEAFAKEKV
ncbi:MAG: aspartate kinase [Eubacteriales bacterium]|nr:aspartate kinase [Eubacteriales bacterium]